MDSLDANDREYLERKKSLEYEFARPYLPLCINPEFESEEELRERVREGLQYLSDEERIDLMREKNKAYKEIYGAYGTYLHPDMEMEMYE